MLDKHIKNHYVVNISEVDDYSIIVHYPQNKILGIQATDAIYTIEDDELIVDDGYNTISYRYTLSNLRAAIISSIFASCNRRDISYELIINMDAVNTIIINTSEEEETISMNNIVNYVYNQSKKSYKKNITKEIEEVLNNVIVI